GSGAHDSSGRRWLPSTPAPAIWVVLVMTDCCHGVSSVSPPGVPHPESAVTRAATPVSAAERTTARGRKIGTSPTVTSVQLDAGAAARYREVRPFVGPL